MGLISKRIPVLDWSIRGGAALAGLVGAVEVAGWLLRAPSYRLNDGCALLAAAAALWLLHTAPADSPPFRLAHALGVLAAMFGGASLANDLSRFIGVPQLVGPDDVVAVGWLQGGHVPIASVSFLFLGAALFVLKSADSRVAVCSQWLALPALALSALGIVGYAYGISPVTAAMAPGTALALFVLALATLASDSTHGYIRIAASDTAGGVVTRGLLVTIPVAIFVLGWAQVRGESSGMFGYTFGAVMTVLLGMAICVVVIVANATALHRTDLVRKEAMARIRDLNARHELLIQKRNEQLSKSLEDLSTANRLLEKLSEYDALTGVANRRYFDKYLDAQVSIGRRHNRTLALVMFDVDAFKAYNDRYGHQAGDKCLTEVAVAIQSCCRRTADIVARYGGEEFAIILPETGLKGALRVAEAAREAVEQLKISHGASPVGPYVSISGGVAASEWKGDDTAQQLIAAADRLLYAAKRQGRNRIVSAPPVAA